MVMLASDLNNPAFVGPVNPDSLLSVEFHWYEPIDRNASEEQGKVVQMKDPETGENLRLQYVRISQGGDHTSAPDVLVREEHKRRWPDKWLYWQIQNGMATGGADVPGWKIEEWTHLSPEQLRDLKHMRFSVVEQIAGASDAQIQRLGMGGLGLREAAKQALRARMGAETKEAMDKKDAEIALLKAADAEKEERLAKMEAFMAQMMNQAPVPPPPPTNTLHAQGKR